MKQSAKINNLRFEIEEDLPEVGFYIYVFNEKNDCIADHLQDNEKMAKEFALEKYNVPLDSWNNES